MRYARGCRVVKTCRDVDQVMRQEFHPQLLELMHELEGRVVFISQAYG